MTAGPQVYSKPDTPMGLRKAADVLLGRMDWISARLEELEPGRGSWTYRDAEYRALDTAVAVLLHEASCRAEEAPRVRTRYDIHHLPMAAL